MTSGIKLTTDTFIEKAIKKHGEKFDYSKVEYIDSQTKIIIICPFHGEYEQKANNHLSGWNCRKCKYDNMALKFKDNKKSFIEKAIEIHNNKYDYSLVEYENSQTKIKVICSIHGTFEQRPNRHLQGDGCKLCSANKLSLDRRSNLEEFIKKAQKIHKNNYSYEESVYINNFTPISIKCNNCNNTFEPIPYNHTKKNGTGCPYCIISSEERRLYEWIKTICKDKIIQTDRKIISPNELDIYFPKNKLAIEYNGIYWHSNRFKPKNYHLDKTNKCEEQGIELLHIFSDEWIEKLEIVKSIIKSKLNIYDHEINSKDLIFQEVFEKDAECFYKENLIFDFNKNKKYYSLLNEKEILCCFTVDLSDVVSVSDLCVKINYNIINHIDIILKEIIKIYDELDIEIISDRRYNIEKLDIENFCLNNVIEPGFYFVNNQTRENLSDKELFKIYNCGLKIYKYIRKID